MVEEVEVRPLRRLSFYASRCNETALLQTRVCSDVCERESGTQAKLRPCSSSSAK